MSAMIVPDSSNGRQTSLLYEVGRLNSATVRIGASGTTARAVVIERIEANAIAKVMRIRMLRIFYQNRPMRVWPVRATCPKWESAVQLQHNQGGKRYVQQKDCSGYAWCGASDGAKLRRGDI